jgi:hypothetical protein
MTDHRPVETWLTDMDGVLVHEEDAIAGAAEFVTALKESGRSFLVLTNNSIFTPRDLRPRLLRSGIDVPEEAKVDRKGVLGIGMGLPGPINRETGTVGSSSILPGWVGVDAAEEMGRRLSLPVHVENDRNQMAQPTTSPPTSATWA